MKEIKVKDITEGWKETCQLTIVQEDVSSPAFRQTVMTTNCQEEKENIEIRLSQLKTRQIILTRWEEMTGSMIHRHLVQTRGRRCRAGESLTV